MQKLTEQLLPQIERCLNKVEKRRNTAKAKGGKCERARAKVWNDKFHYLSGL